MSLEWFDRVCGELQDYMESICDKYDEMGYITIDRASKHPKIDFFVEDEFQDREVFCSLFFDPYNEEFYMEEFDFVLEQTSRTLLTDMEDIIDAVHETFHDFISADDLDDEYLMEEDNHIQWTSPEVTAFVADGEVEVAYQFGVVRETGDGVLRRVNRVMTDDDTMLEDETNFLFSREEAGTIVDLIEENMDLMDGNGYS